MASVLRGTTKFGTNTGYFQGSPTGAKPSGTVEGDLIVIWMSGMSTLDLVYLGLQALQLYMTKTIQI